MGMHRLATLHLDNELWLYLYLGVFLELLPFKHIGWILVALLPSSLSKDLMHLLLLTFLAYGYIGFDTSNLQIFSDYQHIFMYRFPFGPMLIHQSRNVFRGS